MPVATACEDSEREGIKLWTALTENCPATKHASVIAPHVGGGQRLGQYAVVRRSSSGVTVARKLDGFPVTCGFLQVVCRHRFFAVRSPTIAWVWPRWRSRPQSAGRTSSTGTPAHCRVAMAALPSARLANPVRPWVARAIRSAASSRATRATAAPRLRRTCTRNALGQMQALDHLHQERARADAGARPSAPGTLGQRRARPRIRAHPTWVRWLKHSQQDELGSEDVGELVGRRENLFGKSRPVKRDHDAADAVIQHG